LREQVNTRAPIPCQPSPRHLQARPAQAPPRSRAGARPRDLCTKNARYAGWEQSQEAAGHAGLGGGCTASSSTTPAPIPLVPPVTITLAPESLNRCPCTFPRRPLASVAETKLVQRWRLGRGWAYACEARTRAALLARPTTGMSRSGGIQPAREMASETAWDRCETPARPGGADEGARSAPSPESQERVISRFRLERRDQPREGRGWRWGNAGNHGR
jgi:hypothetical protein